MLSYPSSFQSSNYSDKENQNPNSIKVKATGFSPLQKQKQTNNHHDSGKGEEFLSVYQTIRDVKNDGSHNSVKTLLNGFCSTIEETLENLQADNFTNLAVKYLGRGPLTRKEIIQQCLKNKLYTTEQLISLLQGTQPESPTLISYSFKDTLCTNLGELMVEQVCHTLQRGQNITKEQEKIIEHIVPEHYDEEINVNAVMEHYQIMKSQMAGLKAERKNLATQFRAIQSTKIEPRLWSDHFRLEISKALNYRQNRERIGYEDVKKCLNSILTPSQISLVFRHILALQTNTLMPILDTSKTISTRVLKANLLRQNESQISQVHFQQKNINFSLEHSHNRIKQLEVQERQHLQLLATKDQEIERLNRIIDFMQIQKEENEKIMKKQMELQEAACRKKYQCKIQSLIESNQEQARLAQWYQRELEAMVEGTNRENVIRKYLAHKF